MRDAAAVPGVTRDMPLVAVSRSGVEEGLPLPAGRGPEDLVGARHPN